MSGCLSFRLSGVTNVRPFGHFVRSQVKWLRDKWGVGTFYLRDRYSEWLGRGFIIRKSNAEFRKVKEEYFVWIMSFRCKKGVDIPERCRKRERKKLVMKCKVSSINQWKLVRGSVKRWLSSRKDSEKFYALEKLRFFFPNLWLCVLESILFCSWYYYTFFVPIYSDKL